MLSTTFSAADARPRLRGRVSWSLALLLLPFTLIAQTAGTIAGRVSARMDARCRRVHAGGRRQSAAGAD